MPNGDFKDWSKTQETVPPIEEQAEIPVVVAEEKAEAEAPVDPGVVGAHDAASNDPNDEDLSDVDEVWRAKQAAAAPDLSGLSPAEKVASTDKAHTVDKGLTPGKDGATGGTYGDRPLNADGADRT